MEIEIKGIRELFSTLTELQAVDILEKPMQRSVLRIENEMKRYPAQRPGARYVRTGTLGRRWTNKVTKTRDGVEGLVGNNTEYAPEVQSSLLQKWMHKGIWQTDDDVLQQQLPMIIRDFEESIQNVLK